MEKVFTTGLTDAERERLAILVEECAEVQQIAMKILRHGYESYHPKDGDRIPNRELLTKELGDLRCAYKLLGSAKDVDMEDVIHFTRKKEKAIKQYLHFQDALIQSKEVK